MQEIGIWTYEQMVYAQSRSLHENEMHKLRWDFEKQKITYSRPDEQT